MIKSQLKIRNFYLFIVIFTFSFFFLNFCRAATLYLEPVHSEYHQGDIFITEVKLNTEREYINTAKVNLTFSQDILEVKNFSQGNSILTLWVEEPNFSNQAGAISFAGGIPGGYQGQNGLLGKIIFKAKEEGKAEILFQETSQVLLNDGFGTSAELKTQKATFNVLAEKIEVSKDAWQEEIKKDTILPEPFKIEIHQDPAIFEGKYFIVFSTTDKQTGIDQYEIKEGQKDWKIAQSPYCLEDQTLQSVIKVKAVDKAGNERVVEIQAIKKITWKDWLRRVILILIGLGILYLILRRIIPKFKK